MSRSGYGPDEVWRVRVKNGEHISEPLMFTFTAARPTRKRSSKRRARPSGTVASTLWAMTKLHTHEHAGKLSAPSEEDNDERRAEASQAEGEEMSEVDVALQELANQFDMAERGLDRPRGARRRSGAIWPIAM